MPEPYPSPDRQTDAEVAQSDPNSLEAILAERGLGMVLFTHSTPSFREHLTPEEEATFKAAHDGASASEQRVQDTNDILAARGELHGVSYITQPGKFVPGAEKLTKDEDDPDYRLYSRENIPISPRVKKHASHQKDDNKAYEPRILSEAFDYNLKPAISHVGKKTVGLVAKLVPSRAKPKHRRKF